jgi:predicted RNase H-like HicB family nuclease
MKAIDYFAIPYLMQAETCQSASGEWIRRASFPELRNCFAEADTIEDAVFAARRRSFEILLEMLSHDILPPVPRPPLSDACPELLAKELGLEDEFVALIQRDALV